MPENTNKYEVEFGSNDGIIDDDFKNYVEDQFSYAASLKNDRLTTVRSNKKEVWKVQNMVDEADSIVGRSQTYKSPILASLIERLVGTDYSPTIKFEPRQPDDIFIARNGTRVLEAMQDMGDYHKAYQDAGVDLFIAGEAFVLKGYKTITKNGERVPSLIKWEHIPWEYVYYTKDKKNWFILDPDYTPSRLIDEFGEDIVNYNISIGNPFENPYNTADQTAIDWANKEQRIGVMRFYNGTRKQYGVIIGGGALIYQKHTGDDFPVAWIDQWDEGFVPIEHICASAVKVDDVHPLSTVDRTIDIWRSYSAMMAATIARAKKAANPREIIGSIDPAESLRVWQQGEIDRMQGVDIPHFEKVDVEAGSGLVVKTLDVGANNGNVMTWRDAFLEEIMMSETVNLRSAYAGERTLGQDQLRREAEISRINDMIKVNRHEYKTQAEKTMMMLVGVESEFLNTYVGIEDEISAKYGGALADGTVKDVLEDIKEFPFNVVVSINNDNQARKEIQILQLTNSLQTLAQVAPGSKGLTELAYELAKLQNPSLKAGVDDFMPQQPEPQPQAPGIGDALQQAGVQSPQVPLQ